MNSQNKKIIYLSPVPLTRYVSSVYLYEDLKSKNQDVEYWNLGNLIYGKKYNPDAEYKYSDLRELEESLNQHLNSSTIFVVLIYFDWQSLKIYRLFTKYNLFITYIHWGSTKIFSKSSYIRILFMNSSFDNFKKVFQKIIIFYYVKFNFIKPFDLLFLAESSSPQYIKNARKIQLINSPDYEKYYFANKRLKIVSYAVFLDVNLPFHKDNEIFKRPYTNPHRYYEALNNFFDFVENKFKIQVIIAAHPSMNSRQDRSYKRKVFHGNTSELVANSRFVISHHSLSINFAVLNYKSILFICTDEMHKLYKRTTVRYIKDLANYLQMPFINIELFDKHQIRLANVKKSIYNNYKYNYLTAKKTEFKSNGELFSDFLIDYNFNS